ncbi:MAG: riboflavin synthase [Elusimicrobia bacterium]|nr:riboflavin synthase [Elusimicrobiota bacterium]
MFTGLIEFCGTVQSISASKLVISSAFDDTSIGASIAVNGVCLTVTEISGKNLSFDYSPVTDKYTNLSKLKNGDKVNLERALKLGGRLDGHIVSGHVDGTITLKNSQKLERFYKLTFELPKEFEKYIVSKGSVALNGISLTVAEVSAESFSVYIIPQTYNNTVIGKEVNIETDILAKYVQKLAVSKKDTSLTEDFLKENGFA